MCDMKQKQPPPARLEKRKTGCSNLVMDIFMDTVHLPGGGRVENFVVVSPRHRSAEGETGVAIVPVAEGHIGLVHIYRHPLQAWLWEIPRGFIDPDESPLEAARRELAEETGLHCPPHGMQDLGIVAPEPGILAARTHIFAARSPLPGESVREAEFGIRDFRWFEREETERLIRCGDLQDCTSLIALARL